MLCLKHRKSLKGRKPKRNNFFAECQKQYSAKKSLSRVSKKHLEFFAECQKKHSAKNSLPSVFFLPSFFRAALGKEALCRVPGLDSAKMPSPVVRSQLNNPIAQYRSKMV